MSEKIKNSLRITDWTFVWDIYFVNTEERGMSAQTFKNIYFDIEIKHESKRVSTLLSPELY